MNRVLANRNQAMSENNSSLSIMVEYIYPNFKTPASSYMFSPVERFIENPKR